MLIQPGKGRACFEDLVNALKVTIPSRKSIIVIIFSCIWLLGWFMGEYSAIHELLKKDTAGFPFAFLIIWLCLWTLGGCFFFFIIAWNLDGKEMVIMSHDRIKIEHKAFNIGISKEYLSQETHNFRTLENYSPFFASRHPLAFWGIGGGALAFDYGMKTIRFGQGIDTAEADYLLQAFKERGFYKIDD